MTTTENRNIESQITYCLTTVLYVVDLMSNRDPLVKWPETRNRADGKYERSLQPYGEIRHFRGHLDRLL
jgi:hypothetical protein